MDWWKDRSCSDGKKNKWQTPLLDASSYNIISQTYRTRNIKQTKDCVSCTFNLYWRKQKRNRKDIIHAEFPTRIANRNVILSCSRGIILVFTFCFGGGFGPRPFVLTNRTSNWVPDRFHDASTRRTHFKNLGRTVPIHYLFVIFKRARWKHGFGYNSRAGTRASLMCVMMISRPSNKLIGQFHEGFASRGYSFPNVSVK